MTKQEQIAEMMALITTTKLKDGDEVCSVRDYYAEPLAEKLYDEGYRKVDGDNYVSREWHDEQVLYSESEIERLRYRVQRGNELLNDAVNATFREAVLRFAEKLKEKAFQGYQVGMYIIDTKMIDETAKEFLKSDRYFIVYGYDNNPDFGGAHTNPYLCTVKAYNFEQAEQYAFTLPRFYCDMFGRGYIAEVNVVDLTEEKQ